MEGRGAYIVGAKLSDVQRVVNRGCVPVLVRTGKGQKTEKALLKETNNYSTVQVFDNLQEFVDCLLGN